MQSAIAFTKNDKKVINAWALFDWANSVYSLVISTAIFPIYFEAYTPKTIELFGTQYSNSSVYSFSIAFAYLIIAILSPLLSGMADFGGRRMYFLKVFTLIGSLSCMALFFFTGEPQLWLGVSAFILSTIGFAGSIVFYNSYLPIIATEDKYDSISAKGYSYGYVGSVILLVLILVMVQKPAWFGIVDEQLPARIGFVLVGVWWLGFAQLSFRRLPKDKLINVGSNLVKKGLEELLKVWRALKTQPDLKRYLIAVFFYLSGVNTIIYVATIFAQTELGFESAELIIIVLLLQLVAIGGAYLFAWLSNMTSNRLSLSVMVLIWIALCLVAYVVDDKPTFYIVAATVGLVMGGLQALSRSTYSKMLREDEEDVTSYFSFYDVVFKMSIVMGTFLFGWIEFVTGDIRNSVLVIAGLFVIGLVVLQTVNFKRAIAG
jgi:UMF1 family MFS transporter